MFDDIMLSSLLEHEKNVLLLFDVMKTKSGLVFRRSSWRLVAFTDLGDVNDEFDDFNKLIKQGCKEPDQAAYVLILLVCGLFKYLQCPVVPCCLGIRRDTWRIRNTFQSFCIRWGFNQQKILLFTWMLT